MPVTAPGCPVRQRTPDQRLDRNGPWEGLEDVEFATLEYVDWFNHRRRHGEILDGRRRFTTPAAHEADYYRQTVTADLAVTQ